MISFSLKALAVLSLALSASASPCPFGELAERGALPKEEADKFFAARADGEAAVERQMKEVRDLEKREFARQEEFYLKQRDLGQLLLGGGLLNGVLQPFTGALQGLGIPVPQPTGLKEIPGDDGEFPYAPPARSAVRGMCPTLNTMANHGYISRTGITTFAEAANACQITLGFGYDTCVFLSALGLLTGGDLLSGKYSIGGADSRVPGALGISRHGFFEVDNSISRLDQGEGNQADFNLAKWNRLVSITEKYNGQFSIPMFGEERVTLYKESIATNPTFNAGVRWLAVTAAERVFIPRALPNGTDETNANFANIAPFYLNETFPEEWFRRATPYTLADTGFDIVSLLAASPELTLLGQNQGISNFVPLSFDLANITPSTATCFLAATILDETPGALAPLVVGGIDLVSSFLNGAVAPFFSSFNCPTTSYSAPGANAGIAGPSTTKNTLRNGVYQ